LEGERAKKLASMIDTFARKIRASVDQFTSRHPTLLQIKYIRFTDQPGIALANKMNRGEL